MLKFAANLSHLFTEMPFLDRFDAAAAAGFKAVEVLQPYDIAVPDIQRALTRNGLDFLLLNAPGPNYTGGARGFAAMPGREGRFAYDMRRSVRYAEALGASMIHVMSGEAAGQTARDLLIDNLKRACDGLPDGLTLTIEPLNPISMPGYFLNHYDLAAEVIGAVGAPNLGLQYDSFHAHMISGDAVQTFVDHHPIIRHVQVGDAPGRTTPGTGEIDFATLFTAIENSGYDGWISAEYTPGDHTEQGLGWCPGLVMETRS